MPVAVVHPLLAIPPADRLHAIAHQGLCPVGDPEPYAGDTIAIGETGKSNDRLLIPAPDPGNPENNCCQQQQHPYDQHFRLLRLRGGALGLPSAPGAGAGAGADSTTLLYAAPSPPASAPTRPRTLGIGFRFLTTYQAIPLITTDEARAEKSVESAL